MPVNAVLEGVGGVSGVALVWFVWWKARGGQREELEAEAEEATEVGIPAIAGGGGEEEHAQEEDEEEDEEEEEGEGVNF